MPTEQWPTQNNSAGGANLEKPFDPSDNSMHNNNVRDMLRNGELVIVRDTDTGDVYQIAPGDVKPEQGEVVMSADEARKYIQENKKADVTPGVLMFLNSETTSSE